MIERNKNEREEKWRQSWDQYHKMKYAQDNLKTYADTEYGKIKDAMESSKGDYKTAIVAELAAEKAAVGAAADFVIKLQNMMKQTADVFQATDQSYSKGAEMIDKK